MAGHPEVSILIAVARTRKNPIRPTIAGAVALTLIASGASLAHADGMPGKLGPGYTPFSWTGFYIGANGGFGYNYDRTRDFILSNNLGTTVTTRGLEPEGGFGGGQLGCNWQQGPLLWGAEADLQGADVSEGFSGHVLDAAAIFSTPTSASITSARFVAALALLSIAASSMRRAGSLMAPCEISYW